METLQPQYKLILSYDILLDTQEHYYRYVLGEFIPALRSMGLHMTFAWHISYGDYPARMVEFVCEDRETLRAAIDGPHWQDLEARLKTYTVHYSRKVVHFDERFQF
jgi:hypothetical protein